MIKFQKVTLNYFTQHLLVTLLLLSSLPQTLLAGSYTTDDISCGAYKRVLVGTMKGSCLGLVAQASQGYGFIKPRKILQIPQRNLFLITDMGGWKPNKGTLWLLDTEQAKPKLIPLLKNLNLPHGLARDKQGRFYVGEKHQIIRFTIDQKAKLHQLKTVVSNLPAWQNHRHPLTEFLLDEHNNLIVNTAAPSDQCKKNDLLDKSCGEFRLHNTDNAALRKYHYQQDTDTWSKHYTLLASGLRNSMALALHKSGTLLQAENNMDFEGLNTPFEEINVIENNKFYGWPYCYDKKSINPFWLTSARKYCLHSSKYQAPWVVISPHSAPLDMMYYQGEMFPELNGKLILSWHGYRKTGQRIVAYDVDTKGRPIKVSSATYSIYQEKNLKSIKKHFPISQPVAQAHEIINGWNPIPTYRPKGRPVGMTVANDGAIWIVDDTNKAILRLARGKTYTSSIKSNLKTTASSIQVNNKKVAKLFRQNCSVCHTEIQKGNKVFLPESWLKKLDDGKYRLEVRLFDNTLPRMPPSKRLSNNELEVFKQWLKHYKITEPSIKK